MSLPIHNIGDITPDYPHGYGYCQCGCGNRTKPYYNSFRKYFRATHNPLRANRKTKALSRRYRNIRSLGDIVKGYEKGWGYCQCGCGEKTTIYNGKARRYVVGHKSKTPEFRAAQSRRASEQIHYRDPSPFARYGNSISGSHFSPKLNRPVGFMSLYEKKLFEILDSMENVESYLEQPITLPYQYTGHAFNYTPDVLVELKSTRRALIEVKPKSMVDYPRTVAKHNAAREYCAERGIEFIVVTEDQLFRQHIIEFSE